MFVDESELKEHVRSEISEIVDVSQEIENYGFGSQTADLVFITVSDTYWERRRYDLRIKTAITGMTELNVFADLVNEGSVLKQEFVMSCDHGSKSEIRSALKWLSKNHFVVEKGNRVKTTSRLKRHVTTGAIQIYSGSDWQRTFKRAYKCHEFAEYRFVAVPNRVLTEIKEQKEMFSNLEVGLISADTDDGVKVRYFPDGVHPISTKEGWRINEINAAYMNDELEKAQELEEM